MIKNRNTAFAVYVVLFVVFWNIAEMLWRTFISGGEAGGIDIFMPLVLAIVTGFLFFMANNVSINDELEEARKTDGAVIADVRGRDEYAQGHIPGAVSLPADELDSAKSLIPDKNTPVFTYCLTGARSRRAAKELKAMGYTRVINMGGINKYKEEQER